jgi:hypothetical protein
MKKFIAGWALSNHGGVGVIEIDNSGDGMLVQYYDHDPEWVEIQYDDDGEPFVKVGQLELPLNECMRYA